MKTSTTRTGMAYPFLPEASPRKPMDRILEFEEPIEDLEGVVITPPKKDALPLVLEENPDGEIQETLEHREVQPVGDQQPLVVKTPADKWTASGSVILQEVWPRGHLQDPSLDHGKQRGGLRVATFHQQGPRPRTLILLTTDLSRVVTKSVPGAFESLVSLQTGQWTPNQRKKIPSCHHLRQIA